MLLGYLFDLNDHRLHQELKMHAGYRWFCRLDFKDPVPDRSTLIKIRNRWAKAGVLDKILSRVVEQCIEMRLVRGDVLAFDGTQIPARAAVKSLEKIGTLLQMEEAELGENWTRRLVFPESPGIRTFMGRSFPMRLTGLRPTRMPASTEKEKGKKLA